MAYKLEKTLKQNATSIKNVVSNLCEFVDGVCLATVSGYSIYTALKHSDFWYRVLLFAGLVIALQAFVLLVRHFNYSK